MLEPFLGSGSTLIAAEKTGRRCRGLELDPLYVDVILCRYEAVTGRQAVLESTGETYAELAEHRRARRRSSPVPLSNAEPIPNLDRRLRVESGLHCPVHQARTPRSISFDHLMDNIIYIKSRHLT